MAMTSSLDGLLMYAMSTMGGTPARDPSHPEEAQRAPLEMLKIMVLSHCVPRIIDGAIVLQREAMVGLRSFAEVGAALTGNAIKSACEKRKRKLAQRDAVARYNEDGGGGERSPPPIESEVLLTDTPTYTNRDIRALVWYMSQPGKATITQLHHVDNGYSDLDDDDDRNAHHRVRDLVPNPGIPTEVVCPDGETRLVCTVNVFHEEMDAGPRNADGKKKQIAMLAMKVRMWGGTADTCLRFIREIVRMYNDCSKGFDYAQPQILDLYRTKTRDGRLAFSPSPFHSNKNLANIFLSRKQTEQLHRRLGMFGSREEYERIGTPRTLSVLLHGPPGTGKTAIIKGLANHLNRHLVRVNLGLVETSEELREIFHPHRLRINLGDRIEYVHVDMRQRLYVFEEVDLQTDMVYRRKNVSGEVDAGEESDQDSEEENDKQGRNNNNKRPRRDAYDYDMDDDRPRNKLNLKDLLETLDGLMEMDGRVIVWTTNRRDILDPALLRPGRMDVDMYLGNMDAFALRNMSAAFFGEENAFAESTLKKRGMCDALTPAEVMGCMLQAKTQANRVHGAREACDLLADTLDRKTNAHRIASERAAARAKRRAAREQQRMETARMRAAIMQERKLHERVDHCEKLLSEIASKVSPRQQQQGNYIS